MLSVLKHPEQVLLAEIGAHPTLLLHTNTAQIKEGCHSCILGGQS